MPVYMQQGKLRGSNRKMSMPMGPFRTHSVPVNVGRLDVFDAGAVVDLDGARVEGAREEQREPRLAGEDPGRGEIDRALTVRVHAVSGAARREDRGGRRHGRAHRRGRADRCRGGEPVLKTILTSLRSADLRKKLAFTAFVLMVYRFGSYVPVPGIDLDALQAAIDARGSRCSTS